MGDGKRWRGTLFSGGGLADRENAQANLYAEVRAQLEARAQARARVQV